MFFFIYDKRRVNSGYYISGLRNRLITVRKICTRVEHKEDLKKIKCYIGLRLLNNISRRRWTQTGRRQQQHCHVYSYHDYITRGVQRK